MIDSVNDHGLSEDDAGYLETIALLQDEIARLEADLLARDQLELRQSEKHASFAGADQFDDRSRRDEIDRLSAELSAREETINLLLEQLRLVEEAESASRMEWEQLAQWVTDVEERMERQDRAGSDELARELEGHRRQADQCRLQLDLERKTWNDQRRGMEQEIVRLRSMLARSAETSSTPNNDAALAILETENQRLKQLCHDLDATIKSETEALREAIESGRRELDQARKERDCVQDERDREKREFEIALASLRSQTSRTALGADNGDSSAAQSEARSVSSALEADMRIREFRQHLKEIHCHEAEARNRSRLGARLSRLWTRTGPKSA